MFAHTHTHTHTHTHSVCAKRPLTFNPSLRFEREIASERERESVIKNFLQREEERTGDSALERIGEFVFVRVSVSA